MANPNATTISLLTRTRDSLQRNKHPGQSYDGFLQELMTQTTCITDLPTMKRLERYRIHPRENVSDLIVNALDQLDELERKFSKSEVR